MSSHLPYQSPASQRLQQLLSSDVKALRILSKQLAFAQLADKRRPSTPELQPMALKKPATSEVEAIQSMSHTAQAQVTAERDETETSIAYVSAACTIR